jgi:hypothetical protein
MTSIVSSIVFIKSVSGEKVSTGIAYGRTDNDEFIKINFKAFRNINNEFMIQEIKENTIMLIIGRFLNFESELFVIINAFFFLNFL